MKKNINGFSLNNGAILIKNTISPNPINESIGLIKLFDFIE